VQPSLTVGSRNVPCAFGRCRERSEGPCAFGRGVVSVRNFPRAFGRFRERSVRAASVSESVCASWHLLLNVEPKTVASKSTGGREWGRKRYRDYLIADSC
jgi:hypothetical protein